MDSNADDIVYTIQEAALRLKIGRTTMYELVMSGQVRTVTIGRLRRVPAKCIEDYVTNLLEQSADFPTAA